MEVRRSIVHLIAFCVTSLSPVSDLHARQDVSLADLNKTARRWGVDDGLTGGQIIAYTQTKDGNLWLGNREGMFRFNGRSFHHYDTQNFPEVGGRFIHRLCAAIDGSVWLATTNGRIANYADGSFTPGPGHEITGKILIFRPSATGGVLSVGETGKGHAISRITAKGYEEILVSERAVTDIHQSPDDHRIWIIAGGRLAELQDQSLTHPKIGGDFPVCRFLKLRSGMLIALGPTGMLCFEDGEWREWQSFDESLKLPSQLSAICEDGDGGIWFGQTGKGLWIWNQGQQVGKFTAGRGTLPKPTTGLFSDREGNVWITSHNGIFQTINSPFVTWVPPESIASLFTLGLAQSSTGEMLFTTFGGVCRLQPGAEKPELILPRPATEVTMLRADPTGGFWIGNSRGYFVRVADGKETPVPVRGNHPFSTLTGLTIDAKGIAWITSRSGLLRCDPRATPLEFNSVPPDSGAPDGFWQTIIPTPDSGLVAVHKSFGLFRKSPHNDQWKKLTPKGDPAAHRLGKLAYDADGRLWGCNRKTLFCWTGEKSHSLTTSELGVEAIHLSGIVADDEGGIWLNSENQGVSYAKQDDLLAKLKNPTISINFTTFGQRQGLASLGGSFTASGILKSDDGRIWVGTRSGLSAINPRLSNARRAGQLSPTVRIEAVLANDSVLSPAPVVAIPPGTSRFSIRYDVESFLPRSKFNYRYRLSGLGRSWSMAGPSTEAVFQNLAPGRYRFEVAASLDQQPWGSEVSSLQLDVAPLWWQRNSIRFGALLLLFSALFLMIHYRLRSLKKKEALHAAFSRQLINSQEAERKRIAGELHDSLGQSLLVVKNLASLGKLSHTDARTQFGEIADSAASALTEVRTISHALRPPELDRLGLTKAIQATLERLDVSSNLEIRSIIEPIDGALSPEHEISIFRLLQECLNNAVKHANATEITVTLKRLDSVVLLQVEDNGRGFDPAAARSNSPDTTGIGLENMIERARLMNGDLRIHSSPGQGTRITLSVSSR